MKILGIMSGTSLDGLDLALVNFSEKNNSLHYQLLSAETRPYNSEWLDKLRTTHKLSGFQLLQMHRSYGNWIGNQCKSFLQNHDMTADYIASHGHTVFHSPQEQFNFQLGEGAAIAASSGISTISDFRSLDILNKGQGAPLVPIGDKYLFPDFKYCLNLGGFANISVKDDQKIVAYDIVAVNLVLNLLSNEIGLKFDESGNIARSGNFHTELFQQLNSHRFYEQAPPKSLGREWLEAEILPIIGAYSIPIKDKLHTYTHHLVKQISKQVDSNNKHRVLVSGGGAYNEFLIELLQRNSMAKFILPKDELINFKEAIIFAFLAYQRLMNRPNSLASVTGATHDSIGGSINLA